MGCRTAAAEAATYPRRLRISSRTSRTGQEVLVVEVPTEPDESAGRVAVPDADLLGELLAGTACGIPDTAPATQRVSVDDEVFELTLEELVGQSRTDASVVVQSTSRLAGIRSLPTQDGRLAGRELRRLHDALCGQ